MQSMRPLTHIPTGPNQGRLPRLCHCDGDATARVGVDDSAILGVLMLLPLSDRGGARDGDGDEFHRFMVTRTEPY